MKAKVLLVAIAALILCTACAPAGAAPAATPTPTKTPTPTPIPPPTPAGTPDPIWDEVAAELWDNVAVCLVDANRFEARLPTSSAVSATFYWVGTDPVQTHIIEATEEVQKGSEAEYGVLFFDSTDLTKYTRVVVHIEVGSRAWEFWFPVEFCQTAAPQNP